MIDAKTNLKMLRNWIKDGSATTEQAIKVIDALLDSQEPIKPIIILTTRSGVSTADCPRCGKRINDHYHKLFCGYCGQAVKWDEMC